MSVKNKFPDPVADVKLVPKVAYFAPEGVAYFSPEWVAYFAPERWHTIVRIIHGARRIQTRCIGTDFPEVCQRQV